MSLNLFYYSVISRKTICIELDVNHCIDDLYEEISLKEVFIVNSMVFKRDEVPRYVNSYIHTTVKLRGKNSIFF